VHRSPEQRQGIPDAHAITHIGRGAGAVADAATAHAAHRAKSERDRDVTARPPTRSATRTPSICVDNSVPPSCASIPAFNNSRSFGHAAADSADVTFPAPVNAS